MQRPLSPAALVLSHLVVEYPTLEPPGTGGG